MSKSQLEAALAGQLDFASRNENAPWPYPPPVREYPVVPACCNHAKKTHGPFTCAKCAPQVARHAYKPHYRLDFAWPALGVGVEVMGGVWSGGAHSRPAGIQRDYAKSNLAQKVGWTLISLTQRDLTSGNALDLIEDALRTASQRPLRGDSDASPVEDAPAAMPDAGRAL